jgi:hypothetical protein
MWGWPLIESLTFSRVQFAGCRVSAALTTFGDSEFTLLRGWHHKALAFHGG